jgi:hypothetical protein
LASVLIVDFAAAGFSAATQVELGVRRLVADHLIGLEIIGLVPGRDRYL